MRDRSARSIFVIELTALFILLLVMTVVVTEVIMMCRSRSEEAAMMSEAVILATSFAETASVAADPDEMAEAIKAMDSTAGAQLSCEKDEASGTCTIWVNVSADAGATAGTEADAPAEEVTQADAALSVGAEQDDETSSTSSAEGGSHGNEANSSGHRYIVKLVRTYRNGTLDKCSVKGGYVTDKIEVFEAGAAGGRGDAETADAGETADVNPGDSNSAETADANPGDSNASTAGMGTEKTDTVDSDAADKDSDADTDTDAAYDGSAGLFIIKDEPLYSLETGTFFRREAGS